MRNHSIFLCKLKLFCGLTRLIYKNVGKDGYIHMVKEIMKLFVACGIIGGISIAPGMIKTEKVVEPNLDLPTVGTVEKLKELVKKAIEG